MTNDEFSIEFDVLYNNMMSNKAPGLNEYEKSVCLTQAQEAIVSSLYGGESAQISFEDTEEIRRALGALVKTKIISSKQEGCTGLVRESSFYKLPEGLWFITYEEVNISSSSPCTDDIILPVIPVTQDEFYKIYKNPFRTSNNRRVLRLDYSKDIVELVSSYDINTYLVRYIEKPEPIILEDLELGMSIDGISGKTECKLSSSIHRIILKEAVNIAIKTFAPGAQG